jgi:hypothetical protein
MEKGEEKRNKLTEREERSEEREGSRDPLGPTPVSSVLAKQKAVGNEN